MHKVWQRFFWIFCAFLASVTLPVQDPEAVPAEAPAEVSSPLVAITFDDGPRRSTTTALLDGLAQRGVQATFFMIGAQIPECEDLVRRMDEEGHQLGMHTYNHVSLTGLNQEDFDAQVDRTRQTLEAVVGHNGFVLRPPYGMLNGTVKERAGCPIILWSVDPTDWDDKNTARIVNHVVNTVQDGDIILLHDIYQTSVDAALEIVDCLHERGFLFVTVDELARQRHVALQDGQAYRNFYP